MSNTKLLVVVGATGAQGSSVTSHFLENKTEYKIRGLTRNTQSAKARALSDQGVEMVQANLNDISSLEAAFKDANAIFAYTDYDGNTRSSEAAELYSSGKTTTLSEAAGLIELQQGKNIADAAARISSLERLVWSSTVDIEKQSQGKLTGVQETKSKANIWEYMRNHAVLKDKASAVMFGLFVDTIVRFPEIFGWTKKDDGSYKIRVANSLTGPLAWIAMPSDAGSYVKALIDAPAGLSVEAVGGYMSYAEVLAIIREKLNIKVDFEEVTVQEYVGNDESGIWKGVANLMLFIEEYGIRGGDERVLTVDRFAERGYSVKRSGIRDAMERLDWSPLLL